MTDDASIANMPRILCLILVLVGLVVSEAYMEQATVGLSFIHRIRKESFFGLAGNASTVPIKFMVSTLHLPDPPSWLTFLQRNDLQDGFLYGTPPVGAETVHMQVVALNQLTKRTSVKTFTIQMNEQEHIRYLVELRVRNLNLEDLFTGSHLHTVVGALRGLWLQEGDLVLVKVASLPDIEGRIYVPNKPGVIIKEGVLVQIGSMYDFSMRLKRAEVEIEGSASCSDSGPQGEPQVGISSAFSSIYEIDWCKFRLVGPLKQSDLLATMAPPIDLEGVSSWYTVMSVTERHDYEYDFILTVAVPLALALGLLIVFSFIVFCNREGIEKRNRLTNDHQMEQFNMINLVSSNLRYMSARRDGPLPLGTTYAAQGPGTLADRGDGLAPQHGQSPPPYRLPPVYPAHYDSLLSQRNDLELNPGQLGRGAEDEQHLVQPTTSVGRLQ